MSVTVISKRVFHIVHKEKLVPLLEKLRKHAEKQKGFVKRTTFSSVNNPGEYMTISEWDSVDDWNRWMRKKKTRDIQGEIDSIVGELTVFDIYQPEKF